MLYCIPLKFVPALSSDKPPDLGLPDVTHTRTVNHVLFSFLNNSRFIMNLPRLANKNVRQFPHY